MRVTSTIIALCLISVLGWSQEEEKSDTTRVSLGGGTEFMVIQKNDEVDVNVDDNSDNNHKCDHDFTYWTGLDMGFTTLMMTDEVKDDYEWLDINESKSIAVNLNIIETKIPIIKHHLGINTGLGFTWQDFVFSDTLSLVNIEGDSISGVSSLPLKYEKNKLKTGYVKVPLLLEINTSKKKEKNFHIAAGVIGGWNYRSVLKQQYKVDGDKIKSKIKGDYNVNPWSLEATTRVGYGNLTLFASASLTSLFEDGKGPEAYPFTVGITVLTL